ncbi:MAG: helix-turn-helix transcriptional regulator [Geothrix sp.]|uniref:helix-turn-helix domain-containing protein n=1 Tax=Geothrix sp. TaxID=1962974 RepID=UPI003BAEF571
MRSVGYITDDEGRRIFALVPVAQFTPAIRRRLKPAAPSTINEVGALDRLLANPASCLETTLPVNPIRAAREAAGITQSDLAFALRISQPMLSRQEQPLRRVRPSTITRALEAIRRIQDNRTRPTISLEGVLSRYGNRLAASAARKSRDPIERRLLREAEDPVALKEREDSVRLDGERRRPPKRKRT